VRISISIHKTLHEGDTFGELALLDDSPRTATCVANTEVHLAYIEKKDF
jgi:CRP-like cAMP-binding protein